MDDLSRCLEHLGRAVGGASDRASEEAGRAAVDRARRAFLAPRPVKPASRARALVVLAAAGAVVAAVVIGVRARDAGGRPISFEIASSSPRPGVPRPGVVGEWVAADPGAPLPLHFSDRSALTLAPAARLRVTTTNPRGADLLIERGAVHAVIAHAAGAARWAVRAGPFEVRVTGTVFDAAWDPVTESFELAMEEGTVIVTGPLIPPDRAIVAGERLRVSVRDARMELTKGPPEAASAIPAVSAAPSADPPAPPPPVARSADTAPPQHVEPPPPPSWKTLATAGKYRDALTAAEAAGLEREMGRASTGDLLLLADAARLGGNPAAARRALLEARSRGARGHTAFLLGKIAADQGGSAGEALSWMETYLREQPSGAFAEQALGRVVELSRRDPDASARAAARYLARYPGGPHAALARTLVTSPDAGP